MHEAWLKIAGDGKEHFANRRHFFKAGATAMKQILIDNARRKQRLKHGGMRPWLRRVLAPRAARDRFNIGRLGGLYDRCCFTGDSDLEHQAEFYRIVGQ